jgi:hypothetical protein
MQLNKTKLVPVCLRQGLNTSVATTVSVAELLAALFSFLSRRSVNEAGCGKKAVKNPRNLRNPRIKIMKNEANLKAKYLIVTTCSRVCYNVFRPKTQNGTKPNKANFNLCLKVYNISVNSSRCTSGLVVQPALFPGIPAFLRNFFSESKPIFPAPRPVLTHETKGTYTNLSPQNRKKSKPNPNPIQTQLSKWKIPPLNPSPYPLTPLNISFLCAFASLRDKIRANLRNPRLNISVNSCPLVVQRAAIPRFSSETQAKNKK